MQFYMRLPAIISSIVAIALFSAAGAFAQTGKISGQVVDAATGSPLPGVNVVIVDQQQGATTDAEGYYTILNVSPGRYAVRASFVGYASQTFENVNVNIDLTSTVNFELQEATVGLDEVTVQATEPVVKPDVSANVANISATEVENLPVTSVNELVSLQAGVESGMRMRGSNRSEVAFMVDGQNMRSARDNTPFTGISYTAVKEVQVQTGGFNAEYGNVRSGLVNVVTKEGPRDRYTVDVLARYAPPQAPYFGEGPKGSNAYWIRPYTDPEVADVGTRGPESPWSEYEANQYPNWKGWNKVAEEWGNDNDPNNDLTVDQLKELFQYLHRKDVSVQLPDYEIDGGFGGPVPVVGEMLGDLRFFASFRRTQQPYIIPQERNAYKDYTGRIKLTSNVAQGMKLNFQGMKAAQRGLNATQQGWPVMFTGKLPSYPWSGGGMVSQLGSRIRTNRIWGNSRWSPMNIDRSMLSGKFTHTLSPSTFYELNVQRMFSDYFTFQARKRDYSVVEKIGPMELDERPFGWHPANIYSPGAVYMGGHLSKARDTSQVISWTSRFDITSQLNPYSQLKAGAEFIHSDYDVSHAQVDSFFRANTNPRFKWQRQTMQGAAYVQNKLEFQGMVANVGLRAEYFQPGGTWYSFDPFSRAFSPSVGKDGINEYLEKKPIKSLFNLNPRLGISFPVTTGSKLYFNYGHFQQVNDPHDLFVLRKIVTGAIDQVGNPNHPMPKTVAYELGYEHSLFSRYLVRMSGYYKALENQSRSVRYTSLDGRVDYRRYEPLNYEDIRGLEFTIRKNAGRYVRGFVNYTFMAVKRGNFGFARMHENKLEQREYERNTRAHYQAKPVPQPYARFNLEFLIPSDFGPSVAGTHLLGDWRLSFLGQWREGQAFTWTGETRIEGLRNNVRWRDYFMVDMRLNKNLDVGFGDAQLFIDISNVFNIRHLRRRGNFVGEGGRDWEYYMQSLHLSNDIWGDQETKPYPYITGNDEPGDFRKPGVEFQPIEVVKKIDGVKQPSGHPLYYEQDSDQYMQWRNGSWQKADKELVESTLKTKAYINMPNLRFLNFLNPRRARFGIRLSL